MEELPKKKELLASTQLFPIAEISKITTISKRSSGGRNNIGIHTSGRKNALNEFLSSRAFLFDARFFFLDVVLVEYPSVSVHTLLASISRFDLNA